MLLVGYACPLSGLPPVIDPVHAMSTFMTREFRANRTMCKVLEQHSQAGDAELPTLSRSATAVRYADRTFCSKKRRAYFINVLTQTGSVSEAARATQTRWQRPGPTRRTWYRLRNRDLEFQAVWLQALTNYHTANALLSNFSWREFRHDS